MKELTKAEEQIIQVLWSLKKAMVKDIVERLPEPRPAYNTVSTIIRILEKKGFVSYQAFGKTHEYYPLVSRDEYKRKFLKSFLNRYFGNSFQELVSFFSNEQDLTLKELEEIRLLIGRQIDHQKEKNHE